jgi:hypothetical protein
MRLRDLSETRERPQERRMALFPRQSAGGEGLLKTQLGSRTSYRVRIGKLATFRDAQLHAGYPELNGRERDLSKSPMNKKIGEPLVTNFFTGLYIWTPETADKAQLVTLGGYHGRSQLASPAREHGTIECLLFEEDFLAMPFIGREH